MEVTQLLNQYGYGVLFVLLALELIALPIPGETLMTYCGILVHQGHLRWDLSVLFAFLGSSLGMTVAYFLGSYLGRPFFDRHGHWVHLTTDRINQAGKWFDRYGDALVVAAYFIPGIRHVTGYFSGITRIPFRRFALYAYTGAALWVTTFISLGNVLGSKWEHYKASIEGYLAWGAILLGAVIIVGLLVRNYRTQLTALLEKTLSRVVRLMHYLAPTRLLLGAFALASSGFVILGLWVIRMILRDPLNGLDQLGFEIIHELHEGFGMAVGLWGRSWTIDWVLILVGILGSAYVFWQKKTRLESIYILGMILTSELLAYGIPKLIQALEPILLSHGAISLLLNRESLLAVAVYGFIGYVFARNGANPKGVIAVWMVSAVIASTILGTLFIGVPLSSILAGLLFGGMWLCLGIIFLEVSRVLPQVFSDIQEEQNQ